MISQFLKRMGEPYSDRMYEPTYKCPHGNGDNCECQLPRFHGLFVVPILFNHDKRIRHVVVRMQMSHDGGMIEFHDPATDKVIGCIGINQMRTKVVPIEQFNPQEIR